jgi:hypothetical protein
VQIDHALYENVTPEKAAALSNQIKNSLKDANYGKNKPQPGTPEWNG